MADNLNVTQGTGTIIAADDIGGGALAQRVKVVWGPDGTGNDADVASGKPLPIQLRGSAGGDVVKLEDGASASGDPGMPILAVQLATPTDLAGTDADYAMLQMAGGRLWVDASGKTLTVGSHAVTNAGTFAVQVTSAPSTAVTNAGTFAVQNTPVATEAVLGKTVGIIVVPSSNFNRPGDTTAYAVGDAVSNSTTAGSVVALSWTAARIATGNFYVRRAKIKTSSTSVTSAAFRLHLYGADPTTSTGIVNGDNAAFSTKVGSYLGAIDITVSQAFSDAAVGIGAPNVGSEVNVVLASGSTLYGLLEARGAYTPTNAETFTVDLEIWQN